MLPGYIVLQLFCSYNIEHVIVFSTLHVLYFYISTSQTMCPSAQYNCFLYFLGVVFSLMLLGYFVNDFKRVPVAPVNITSIIFVFTFKTGQLYTGKKLHP